MSCFEFWSLHSLSTPSLFPLCITISGRRLDSNLLLLTCRKNKTKLKKWNKSTSYYLGVDRRGHTQGASIELCNFPLSPSLGIWAFWQVLAWCHLKSKQLFEWKFPSQVLWKFPSHLLRKLVLKNLPRQKPPSEVHLLFSPFESVPCKDLFCFLTTCTIVREREKRRELCVCVIFSLKREKG
jgi:hypothetical protein